MADDELVSLQYLLDGLARRRLGRSVTPRARLLEGLAVLVRGKPGFVVGHELDTAAATPSFRVLISGAELWVAPRDAELERDEADELLDEAEDDARRKAAKRKAAARRRAVPAPPSEAPVQCPPCEPPAPARAIRARQPVADEDAPRGLPLPARQAFLLFCAQARRRSDVRLTVARKLILVPEFARRRVWEYLRPAPPAPGGYSPLWSDSDERRCNCLAGDCELLVEVAGPGGARWLAPTRMADVRAGDVVATGSRAPGEARRRVARVWVSAVRGGACDVIALARGCRLTPGHPVVDRASGRWMSAGAALGGVRDARVERGARERAVYGIELEGHVDTVLVGGAFVVAAIGAYCGPRFGWNVFTRKSSRCDARTCAACDVAVLPGPSIDFADVRVADLAVSYAPYAAGGMRYA